MAARLRVTSVDSAPDDLYSQVPFTATLLRKVAGPDKPDYWLAELEKPLSWVDAGAARQVTHIVVATRYEGQTITEDFTRLIVGLAYVTDPSALIDADLSFAKCRYVAIGEMEAVSDA
jgi:hypothetical protein